ncbi:MAG: PQQ-binding-like beta-propeller repeat protein [Eubacteriales bacterium]|nr:PQQ-binding-like beta-propeller repeat protein [Eubacteriales bacterium]
MDNNSNRNNSGSGRDQYGSGRRDGGYYSSDKEDNRNVTGSSRNGSDYSRTSSGTPRSTDGYSRTSSGTPRSSDGYSRTSSGTPYSTDGYSRSSSGTPRSSDGYSRSSSGTPRSADGYSRSSSGTPRSTDGYSRSSSGTPYSTDGYSRSSSGTPRSSDGYSRSSSGTPRSADGYSRSSGGSGYTGGPRKKKKKKRYRMRVQPRFFFIIGVIVIVLILIAVVVNAMTYSEKPQTVENTETSAGFFQELFKTPTPSPTPSPSPTPTPSPTPPYEIPHAVDSTQPSVYGLTTAVEVDGTKVDTYKREEKVEFMPEEPYTSASGIITFRGNNYRDSASYGTATISARKLTGVWSVETGELPKGDVAGVSEKTWTGSGWVGQPLIVQWPDNIKQFMNMYDWAKQKEGLVEVILATMDGNVYFLDLDTGEPTREKLVIGMPFKGAGSLDPRGYPILYLGSGDMYVEDEMKSRAMAYSLIDFTRLYEFGKQYDEFALREFHAYDSSALVDAETDTLIYPGENGILYTIKLNTVFDETTGQLTMNPSNVVKMRYAGTRSTYPYSQNVADNKFWLGYETSMATLGEFGYLGTNDGFLQCINLNTMSLVWAQDTQDDTNGSPVLETDFANRTAYIYIGSSLHFTADADAKGAVSLYKINAITGEVVWKHTENVNTKSWVSGGIQATALLGQKSISDLVIIPFARTPNEDDGVLLALDKATGAVRWTFAMEKYTWSSPVAVYDESGNAYIVVLEGSDTGSKVFLLDGKTGTLLSTFDAEKNMEASPAVYGNMVVFGTRGMKIWGVKIS